MMKDIENIEETFLNQQKQLHESQSSALEVLQTVATFQPQPLEECRGALQQHLFELVHNQQQELIQRQEQLKHIHDHLVKNLKIILAAKETFESKQASMVLSLEKLFTMNTAILLDSRLVKAFLIYCILIFTLSMLTSTNWTYSVRSRLYIGLSVIVLIELLVLRYGKDMEQQAWIISIRRSIFVMLSSCQLLYATNLYRDYESLNHQMLHDGQSDVDGHNYVDAQSDVDGLSDVELELWIERRTQRSCRGSCSSSTSLCPSTSL